MIKIVLVIFLTLWLALAFSIVFWPYNFTFHNSVTFPEEVGLHFKSPSIAYSNRIPQQFREVKKFSIITKVQPDRLDRDGVLFGYCIDHSKQNFLALQKGDDLGFYLTDTKVVRHIWVPNIFEENQSIWIAILYDGRMITILKNGTVHKEIIANDLDFSLWNNSFPFVLANTGIGSLPWSGTIYSLDIFDSAVAISNSRERDSIIMHVSPMLSLPFPHSQVKLNNTPGDLSQASLVIPSMFIPPAKGLISNLHLILTTWDWDLKDFMLNIIFFVPLGLFLRPLLEKSTGRYTLSFWMTVIAGLSLTIIIETIQIVLPFRDTSIQDVFGNTIGTIAGSFVIANPLIRKYIY